jgi:hypothetical protein
MNSLDLEPEQSLLDLFFDQYSRYRAVADIIRKLLPSGGSVLDVGCGPAATFGTFFDCSEPYRLCFVDPLLAGTPPGRHRQVVGTIFAPELDDETFDLVVSVDTLEHVPESVRPGFLDRLLKLSRGCVVLACPCADAGVGADVDSYVNAVIEQITGRPYSWLDEHFEYGLPRLAWITEVFDQAGWTTVVAQNGHGPWLKEILPYIILAVEFKANVEAVRSVSRIFNRQLYRFDGRSPCYRQIVIAAPAGTAIPELERPNPDGGDDEAMAEALLAIRRMMLTQLADGMLREQAGVILRRDQEIHRLNGVVAKASEDLIALRQMVRDRDTEIHRLNGVVAAASEDLMALSRMVRDRDAEKSGLEAAARAAMAEAAAGRDELARRALLIPAVKESGPSLRTRAGRLVKSGGRRAFRVLPAPLQRRLQERWLERAIRASGLFDEAFYRETYPDVPGSGLDPLVHYRRLGAAEGRWPNPLFDPAFYLEAYPEVRAAGLMPLVHYLRFGAAAGAWPNLLFDPAFYLATYPDVAAAGLNPLVHYLRWGAAEGRWPNPLFDPAFYLEAYPEVRAAGLNPLVHYLHWGAAEGRRPNLLFDPAFYLATYPDVAAAGLNPPVHYLRWGAAEGRWPNPLFDPAFYLKTYPDVATAGYNPLYHYLRWGAAEGRQPNLLFDPAFYLETYPDVAAAGLNPLFHYLQWGAAEGRWPNPLFDSAFYLKTCPDVGAAGLNPLSHYLRWGIAEGRWPNPLFDPAYYLATCSDLGAAGCDPLSHYLQSGAVAGWRPNPLFDSAFYLATYPEVGAAGLNPLSHYLRWGAAEGRLPDPLFDGAFYLETYPEVAAAGDNPLSHYLRWGAAEGRKIRRSPRSDRQPQTLPEFPDLALAPTLLPFPVPAVASGTSPVVSIVVPVDVRGLAEALCCLHALGRQDSGRPCEVIAVFAGDDGDARDALARVGGLVLAPVPAGTGVAAACNHGADRAGGERLVFLSPDVIVQEGWLDELAAALDRLPQAGLAGALVIGAGGWIEAEGGSLYRDGSVTLEGRGEDPALSEHSHARAVCWCPAGALMVDAALFRRLGGFETAAWAALRPELALSLAVRAAGFKVWCQSTARVVRLPAAGDGYRTTTAWPATTRVPLTDPRWTALLGKAPAPVLTGLEQDRALGRRHLLVIDRRLPVFDGEPAGLAAFMALFCELGYRVTFATLPLPQDRTPEVRALERLGIHVLRQKADISVLSFLHREEVAIDMLLFAHPGVAALLRSELSGLVSPARWVLSAGGLDVGRLTLPEAGTSGGWHEGRAGLALLRDMTLTLVGNGTERDALRHAVPDCPTLVMPSVIPVAGPAAGNGAGFADRRDLVLPASFEDWQDGEAAVAFVLDDWPLIRERLPGVRLVILATRTAPPVIRALQSAEILVREGPDQVGAVLAGARLAVAPHRSWGGFNQAVATAIAHGVPAVLSPPVARGLGLSADEPGLVAQPGAAFAGQVVAAWGDEPHWTRLSADGIRHAAGHWSTETVRQRLIRMLHHGRFTPTYEMSEWIRRQALAAKGISG